MALGGAAGGMVLAGLLLGILPRILSDAAPLPGGTAPTLNLWLVGLALLVSLLSSLAVSALPVLRTRNTDLASTLGEGARGASGGKGHLRGTLLAGEVALAIVLLMGTGLLLRSMGRLMGRDLGYQPKDLVTFIVDVNTPGLRQPAPMEAFRRTLLERVRSLPGIEMAAVASHSPVESIGEFSKIHLGTESPRSEDPEVPILCVSEGYFETLGVRTIQGRRLSDLDGPSAPAVVMVNQAFANRFFPGGEAVGQVLRASYLDGPLRIVGVVADMRTGGPEGEVQPLLIHPVGQLLNGEFCVTLRTRRALQDLSPALEEAVRAANASRKPLGLARVTEEVRSSLDERRNTVILLGAFAALALTLATVGIYGVTAYTVTQRRREIGIRLALGGHPSTVVGNVLRRELAFIGSGTCLGLVASLGLGRILQTQLVEVGPTDPGVLLGAVSTLALAGALACLMPALRVTSADPSSVLHEE